MLPTFLADFLNPIIHSYFGVLDKKYIDDLMIEVVDELESEIARHYEVRYIVLDGETGQIESRTLHETRVEAEKTVQELGLKSYYIGELFVPVP